MHLNIPPTKSLLTIDVNAPLEHEISYRMVNLQGSMVMQGRLKEGLSKNQLEVGHLAAGLYYIELSENGRRLAMEKVMVLE